MISISNNKTDVITNSQKEDWEPHINVINNNIWYTGNMTLISINNLIKELQEGLNNKHVDVTINLFISSPGGCITSSLMLYNFLNLNYKDINIIGTSKLCSSATYLLFTKCNTFVYPNIYVLFHPMNFEFNDNQQAVNKRNSFYKRLVKMVNDVYKTKNFRCNWNTTDVYLYADDLIKKGIIEGIWQEY